MSPSSQLLAEGNTRILTRPIRTIVLSRYMEDFLEESQNQMHIGLLLGSSYPRVFEILFEKIAFLRRHWNVGHGHSRVHSFEAGLCRMQFQSAEQCDNGALLNRLDPLWRISYRLFGTPLLALSGAFLVLIGILGVLGRKRTRLHFQISESSNTKE